MNTAFLPELVGDGAGHIDWNREAIPMLTSATGAIWELMPTSSPFGVHERSARVSVIDWSVGLQEVLVASSTHSGEPPLRADNAHRHGLSHAERVADRQNDITHLNRIGVAEGNRVEIRGLDLDHGQVAGFVSSLLVWPSSPYRR